MKTPRDRPDIQYDGPRPPGASPRISPVGRARMEATLVPVPKLDSPFVRDDNTLAFPWYQTLVNISNLMQPTGVIPGTYLGISVNAFGQVTSANVSGITVQNPTLTNPIITNPTVTGGTSNNPTIFNANLTGLPIAPTQGAGNNSNAVATTAFVKNQGYITGVSLTGDVNGSGTSTFGVTVVGLQGHPVSTAVAVGQALIWNGSAWAPGPVGIPEAPMDGQAYARQSGAWVVVVVP